MQQTNQYNFKLIDTSDTFSPDALNDNAKAVEAELVRIEAELAAGDNAVRSELTAALANQKSQLEANHTALAQTVAAVEKGAFFCKLGEASAASAGQTMAVTGINAADYAVLLLFVRAQEKNYSVVVTANNTKLNTISFSVANNYNTVITAWLTPALNGGVAYTHFYTVRNTESIYDSGGSTEHIGGIASLNWSDITRVQISGSYKAGANFILYGIKK